MFIILNIFNILIFLTFYHELVLECIHSYMNRSIHKFFPIKLYLSNVFNNSKLFHQYEFQVPNLRSNLSVKLKLCTPLLCECTHLCVCVDF